jgi:hypothetical protein
MKFLKILGTMKNGKNMYRSYKRLKNNYKLLTKQGEFKNAR